METHATARVESQCGARTAIFFPLCSPALHSCRLVLGSSACDRMRSNAAAVNQLKTLATALTDQGLPDDARFPLACASAIEALMEEGVGGTLDCSEKDDEWIEEKLGRLSMKGSGFGADWLVDCLGDLTFEEARSWIEEIRVNLGERLVQSPHVWVSALRLTIWLPLLALCFLLLYHLTQLSLTPSRPTQHRGPETGADDLRAETASSRPWADGTTGAVLSLVRPLQLIVC